MSSNSLVSIIIPSYNVEKYISICLISALQQTYDNLEVIVVDDGSTDNTVNEIRKIVSTDQRIKLFIQSNGGAPSARNNGLMHSSGKYILFLDSDDVLEKDAIENLINEVSDEKIDLVIGNYSTIDQCGKKISNLKAIKKRRVIEKQKEIFDYAYIDPLPITKLYKKSIIDTNNIIWDDLKIGQDLNFFLKYILCCEKIAVTNKIVANYRILENSISRTYSLKIFDIVKSFENTKEFYKEKCALPIYEKNFLPLEMRHYYWQMSKYKFFPKDKQKEIIDYFTECIRNTEIHFYNFSLEDMFIYMKFQVKKHLYKYLI